MMRRLQPKMGGFVPPSPGTRRRQDKNSRKIFGEQSIVGDPWWCAFKTAHHQGARLQVYVYQSLHAWYIPSSSAPWSAPRALAHMCVQLYGTAMYMCRPCGQWHCWQHDALAVHCGKAACAHARDLMQLPVLEHQSNFVAKLSGVL